MVIQGDNTGSHNEAAYINYVKSYCDFEWYYWEPQAPQMPHLNVLDLSFFLLCQKDIQLFLETGVDCTVRIEAERNLGLFKRCME